MQCLWLRWHMTHGMLTVYAIQVTFHTWINAHRNDYFAQTFLFPGLKFRCRAHITGIDLPHGWFQLHLVGTTRLHPPTTMGGKSVQNLALLDT